MLLKKLNLRFHSKRSFQCSNFRMLTADFFSLSELYNSIGETTHDFDSTSRSPQYCSNIGCQQHWLIGYPQEYDFEALVALVEFVILNDLC